MTASAATEGEPVMEQRRPSRPVRVGLFLSHQKPPDADPVRALEQQLEMVRLVRDAGWDSVMTGQHYLLDEVRKLQPFPFLARIAAESGEMRLGAAVLLLALHNPVQVAEEVATLDIISGGRFVLGVALGYRDEEYAAFGVPRTEAVRRFETNLRVVMDLLEGRSVDVSTPWCRTSGAQLTNLPVQRPRPEIWIGANADAAVRRAARMGDTWIINPHARRATVARQLELFRSERIAHALDPDPVTLPALKEVFCAPTREQAFRACLPYLGEKYRHYAAWGQDRTMPDDDTLALSTEQLVDDRFVIGTPNDCLRTLAAWRDDLGVDTFILRTEWVGMPHEVAMGSLELLARSVVPALIAGRSTI